MKILIVEDEPAIARRLERMTRELLGERVTYINTVARIDDALESLASAPTDLLLLDLNLNGKDGFELLEKGIKRSFHTIVVSAHVDQALRAFEIGVTDFVPKPFGRERLNRALQRVLAAKDGAEVASRNLAVKRPGGVDLIAFDDLFYAKGAGAYAELVLRDGSTELFHETLETLLRRLPPVFARTHKSYVVRMDQVKSLLTLGESRYELVLSDDTRLPVGRTRLAEVRARLSEP